MEFVELVLLVQRHNLFFRVATSNLPEIRHKTAVSTIRSTAEKSATREKSEKKLGDTKKKPSHHKQDISGG